MLFAYGTARLEGSSALNDSPRVDVKFQYCGVKPQKPPLETLYFRVCVRNLAAEPLWVLLPAVIYSAPTHARSNGGVSRVELLSDESRAIKLLKFAGTARPFARMPNAGGGFQGILLAGKTELSAPVVLECWGRPNSALPLTAAIARSLILGNEPVSHYFHTPVMSSSTTNPQHLSVVESWETKDDSEIRVAIEKIGEVVVDDVLAKRCEDKKPC